MAADQILFLIVGAVTLLAALMVVTNRNMIRAALFLILALFGQAILYVMLEAGFFAVVQVVVYIGAISILFIFAVMLIRNVMEAKDSQTNSNWPLAAFLGLVLFGSLVFALSKIPSFNALPPALTGSQGSLEALGQILVSPDGYVIPFEVASVLLVAAMVGAIYVAWGKK